MIFCLLLKKSNIILTLKKKTVSSYIPDRGFKSILCKELKKLKKKEKKLKEQVKGPKEKKKKKYRVKIDAVFLKCVQHP